MDLSSISVEEQVAAFGVYLNGRIPVGSLRFEVAHSAKRWVDIESQWTMRLGASFIQRSSELRLDTALALRRQKHKEVRTEGPQKKVLQTVTTRKAADRWRIVHRDGPEMARQDLTVTEAVYSSSPESLFLLAGALATKGEGRYRFSEVTHNPSGVSQGPEVALQSFTVDVHVASSYTHRGVRRSVRVVRIHHPQTHATTFIVDTSGHVLAFWMDEAPVRFIAGSEEEVLRQLPVAEGVVDGADPRVAIRTVLEVMVGAQPAERLDDVVDWRSVILKLGKIATPDAMKEFQREVKVKFISTPPPFRLEEIPKLVGMMDVIVDTGMAQVRMYPGEAPFLLEQRDERWWIVGLPVR